MPEAETLEVDVLVVGAGPAGLAAAIRLHDLSKAAGRTTSVLVIDKAREIGAHGLSGAVIVPDTLKELFPDAGNPDVPSEGEVYEDFVYHLLEKDCIVLPVTPPPMRNEGNLIVSLSQLVRWLAGKAEEREIDVFPEFPGVELLVEEDRVVGVRTGDKGIDKNGERKPNFEPGVEIRAKITILAEGPRGHLTRQAVERFRLDKDRNPQTYATGVKEIWQVPEGRVHEGRVIHTMGWPLRTGNYGGGFIYALKNDRLCVGFVVGLGYKDPFMDPHHEFQRFKTHPKIRGLLEGGKMVEYGAKTIPEGGWFAVPKLYAGGLLLVGDSAGFLDAMRLKGVHLAVKSGILAAETANEAFMEGNFAEGKLASYADRVETSCIRRELWSSRYFKHGFKFGLFAGMLGTAFSIPLRGWSPFAAVTIEDDHKGMRKIEEYYGRPDAEPQRIRFDGKLTFDKMTDIYNSGTQHNEDQPAHLKVLDPDLCAGRCTREYGNPCQHFCPAGVYEWVREENGSGKLMINFSNCVHCKTCDIMDPYGIIRWVPPEGGGGPGWQNL